MSYTPGTWKIEKIGDGGDGGVFQIVSDEMAHPICEYASEGDARLIAAAPELVEALERCASRLSQNTGSRPQEAEEAYRLLARIKGEA